MIKLKLKKNDSVIVITGKDKNKKGKILKVFPKENKAVVAGINVVKKHNKPSKTTQGGIVSKEMPIHISNLAYFDEDANAPSKIKFVISKEGNKERVSKKSGKVIKAEV